MRPTAFLSYSHADQDRVRVLASALEQAGIDVWWDTLIEGGAVFAKSVEVALARCDAVIVAYMDVDLSTGLDALLPLIAPLVSGHSDLAIGSRYVAGGTVRNWPWRRLVLSWRPLTTPTPYLWPIAIIHRPP